MNAPATSTGTNGATPPRPAQAAATATTKGSRRNSHAESFAQIVGVMMRDKVLRGMALADLEWLVIPPLLAGQYGLAHAAVTQPGDDSAATGTKTNSKLMPVAVALWARVSDRIDKTLADPQVAQPRLRPADWTSGDNIWIMATAGDQRAVPTFLKQLAGKDFKGRSVKMRVRGRDGTVSIRTLDPATA